MRPNDEIIDLLNQLKDQQNMSLSELARRVGMAKSALSRYFNKTREFPLNKVQDFANVLGVSSEYILGFDTQSTNGIEEIYNKLTDKRKKNVYEFAQRQLKEQENKVVPLVGHSAANPSELSYGDAEQGETIEVNVPSSADCAVVIKGDSMEPLIHDGDIVFYRNQPDIENGEIAIVEVEGNGVTCKKVYFNYDEEIVVLRSLNEKYGDRELSPDEVRFLGKVIK